MNSILLYFLFLLDLIFQKYINNVKLKVLQIYINLNLIIFSYIIYLHFSTRIQDHRLIRRDSVTPPNCFTFNRTHFDVISNYFFE